VQALTTLVFLPPADPASADALPTGDVAFVFGGCHPALAQQAAALWAAGRCGHIVVTGGHNPHAPRHADWPLAAVQGHASEAQTLAALMRAAGVHPAHITAEDQSLNSLQNVRMGLQAHDCSAVRSLVMVTKAHLAGRHLRTLQRHVPGTMVLTHTTVDDEGPAGEPMGRDTWPGNPVGRATVWGEALRIVAYGRQGDLVMPEGVPQALLTAARF
jgi:uncharacterized SAM-binding protein YcdF (DUF218 family)